MSVDEPDIDELFRLGRLRADLADAYRRGAACQRHALAAAEQRGYERAIAQIETLLAAAKAWRWHHRYETEAALIRAVDALDETEG